MVYFNLTNSMYGAGLWALLLAMGMFQMYISKIPLGATIFLATFLPFIKLASMSQYFAINIVPLFVACILTATMLQLFKLNKKVKKAMEDPASDKITSMGAMIGLGVFFIGTTVALSTQMDLYKSYNKNI
tara:strand:+ start:32 stop:421 length:390 start_codon:yes stop_codon:yes gene_type:complete